MARRASEKPDPTKPVTVDPAETLALQRQLALIVEKNQKILLARQFIGATTDEEIKLLEVLRNQTADKILGVKAGADTVKIVGEVYEIENKILALKEKQTKETERLAEAAAKLARSERDALGSIEQQQAQEEARGRIIGAADPEAQAIVEQKRLIDKFKEKQDFLNKMSTDANAIRQVGLDLLREENNLKEMQRSGRTADRPDARTFTIGGGVSLGATDSMRIGGVRPSFDSRLGGVDPRWAMGVRSLGIGKAQPGALGMGTRTLTVQESIAKTAHDQLVALRQIATNVLKIGGATAQ